MPYTLLYGEMGGQKGGLWALPGPIEKSATHATRGSGKKTQFHSKNFVRTVGCFGDNIVKLVSKKKLKSTP